jgi:predicted nucleic acid-binding protein
VRVLVDSSAWIEFLNGSASPVAEEVDRLLGSDEEICTCGLVVTEVTQGLRRQRSFPRVVELFRSLTLLELQGIEPYLWAGEIYRRLRAQGTTVRSAIDCLVVSTAETHDCWLLARDRDIDAILESGISSCRAWVPADRP